MSDVRSALERVTCQLCYGQNGEHQKDCPAADVVPSNERVASIVQIIDTRLSNSSPSNVMLGREDWDLLRSFVLKGAALSDRLAAATWLESMHDYAAREDQPFMARAAAVLRDSVETEAPHAALDRWIAKWGGYVDPVTVALDELRSIAGTQKPCAEYVPPHPYLCVTCGKSRSAHSPEKSGEEPLTVSKVPQ